MSPLNLLSRPSRTWFRACAMSAVGAVSLLMVACASRPPAEPAMALLHDEFFAAPNTPVDPQSVFALSPAMRTYADTVLSTASTKGEPRRALIEALYSRQQLRLSYDAGRTRNAAQAFEARAGNCLSLVIMTAALAHEIGLSVQYRTVFVDENWSRSGDLYVSSGHVNLTLGPRATDVRYGYNDTSLSTTIDFLPPEDVRGQRSYSITEQTVLAMYMNNRAAEALARGRLNDAYAWARAAVVQEPRFLPAHNTLGVVYQRHHDAVEAEQVFRGITAVEPDNTTALSNLAQLLREQGRSAEAQQVAARLHAIQPVAPYEYFNQGQAAMQRADYRTARDLFAREVDRAAYNAEFHFWLALAFAGSGDLNRAREHMAIAQQNSATRDDRDLYTAKLDRLNAVRRQ
jgi:Tfp pilus assembly protein PilF